MVSLVEGCRRLTRVGALPHSTIWQIPSQCCVLQLVNIRRQIIDKANRDARAAEMGVLDQRRRTARQRRETQRRLTRYAAEVDDGLRTVTAYLEAVKHLFRHRLPVMWMLVDDAVRLFYNHPARLYQNIYYIWAFDLVFDQVQCSNTQAFKHIVFHINGWFITTASEHFLVPFSRSNYITFSLLFTAPRAWNFIIWQTYRYLDDIPRCKSNVKNCYKDS